MPAKKRKKSEPTPRNIVVTVDDASLPRISEIAKQLRSRGLKVDSVLEATGLITGSTTEDDARLQTIPGVVSVEESPEFHLPPPDSPIQ